MQVGSKKAIPSKESPFLFVHQPNRAIHCPAVMHITMMLCFIKRPTFFNPSVQATADLRKKR
jgi:hypothetical protein